MKTPQQLSQEIIDIIKATGNYFVGNTSGMSNDGTVNVYHPKGYSISAIAANPISSGEVIVFKVNDTWYAFGEQRTIVKQDVLIQRKSSSSDEVIYPVITLLNVDLYLYPKPPDNNLGDFWLTGGKNSLKKIDGFNVASNETVGFSARDGFLLNLGNKFIATTNSYLLNYSYYNDDYNKRFYPQKYKFLVNNQITTIESNEYNWNAVDAFNPVFCYLGNNIWQSYIEIGTGFIINNTNKYLKGAIQEDVPGAESFEELKKNVFYPYSDINAYDFVKLDAVILPDNSNKIIHDGIVETLSNSSTVENLDVSSFDVRYALRNRTVNCTTWTPSGNTTFTYTATRSGNYTYTENIQGELLGLHFGKQYITQQFNYTQTGTYTPKTPSTDGYNRSFTYSGINNLFLKSVGSESTLQLNSSGKFLVVPLRDEGLTLESTGLSLSFVESASFFRPYVDYSQIQSLNLSEYIGEPVLFFQTINNKPYAIRGDITSVTYSPGIFRFALSVTITEFKPIPYSQGNENSLPTYYLILDNGCFWNYYLSQYDDGFNTFADVKNPCFIWANNEYNTSAGKRDVWKFSYEINYNTFVVKCNQTLPFIHLSPISRYTIRQPYSERIDKINSDSLLSTDNLIGRKIYRVCYDYYVNEYTSFVENSNKQRAIAQWGIDNDGNVKYEKTFLVDYKIKFPYLLENGDLDAQGIIVSSHSYHP